MPGKMELDEMSTYTLDLCGPEKPEYDLAAKRVIREIKAEKKFLESMIALPPAKRQSNWIFKLVLTNKDVKRCKAMAVNDPQFKDYLKKELLFNFGETFTKGMFSLFDIAY